MSAAARNAEPRQPRRRRAAPSSTTAQTTFPAADPITRSGDPASRFPSQANTRPSLPEVWAQLDAIDLVEEFQQRVGTFVGIPQVIRGEYIRAQDVALSHFVHATSERDATWAGKLFRLLSRMLLSRTESRGDVGAKLLRERVLRFQRGEWTDLIREAALHRAPRQQSAGVS